MSSTPQWIARLVESVCQKIQLFDEESPIGCHYFNNNDSYEVSVFVSSTEVVGGPNDGQRIAARFIVDVIELIEVFDVIDSMTWQPQIVDETDEVGPHFSISGTYAGETVWLRILGETPEQFSPGRIAEFHEHRFVNIWEDPA